MTELLLCFHFIEGKKVFLLTICEVEALNNYRENKYPTFKSS